MPKKRWDDDGPRRSSGFGHDWTIHNTIMRMSAESAAARKEANEWLVFLAAHPVIHDSVKRDLFESNLSPDTIADRLKDLIKRHAEEQRRRKKALEG